jgi:hypothetical protein
VEIDIPVYASRSDDVTIQGQARRRMASYARDPAAPP